MVKNAYTTWLINCTKNHSQSQFWIGGNQILESCPQNPGQSEPKPAIRIAIFGGFLAIFQSFPTLTKIVSRYFPNTYKLTILAF